MVVEGRKCLAEELRSCVDAGAFVQLRCNLSCPGRTSTCATARMDSVDHAETIGPLFEPQSYGTVGDVDYRKEAPRYWPELLDLGGVEWQTERLVDQSRSTNHESEMQPSTGLSTGRRKKWRPRRASSESSFLLESLVSLSRFLQGLSWSLPCLSAPVRGLVIP